MMTELPPAVSDLPEEEGESTALVPLSAAGEWHTIVDNIVDNLSENEYPTNVIKAAEYLICGWPTHKVAERIGVKKETIRGWLTRYPEMAVAVNYGQRELHRWRMARLEQQFVSAVEASQEILDIGTRHTEPTGNMDNFDPKLLALKAQQARFIISIFAGQKMDLKIRNPAEDKPQLKAQQEALDYLATRIAGELDNTVVARPETTYRVTDVNTDTHGPLLNERGDPFHGTLGEFDQNEAGITCHVCGSREKKLYLHITKGHKMKDREYEMVFMLDRGMLREYGG
jgi:hypothetical protein